MSFVAGVEDAGRRLDVVLATKLSLSRSQAAARIDAGEVRVAGRVVARSYRLAAGDRVEVASSPPPARVEPPPLPPLRYHDEHLVVVAKPAGLVVHPGAGHDGDTLVDALRAAGVPLADLGDPARPGIVHRLDRDTSGLLVVASTAEAAQGLIGALRHRAVTRRYLALVAGVPAEPRGCIDAPIGRDPRRRTRFAVVRDGKPAVTRYVQQAVGTVRAEPADAPGALALLVCTLETGRTHQIRVHLHAIGNPVVGDPVYGPRPSLATALALRRPFLHAAVLGFDHPVTGEPVTLAEPLPGELVAALARAGIDVPDPLVA